MIAARWAVIFAKEIGLQQSHFEGDSETTIKAHRVIYMLFSSFGYIVGDILIYANSLRRCFSFSHMVKKDNVVAHVLIQGVRLSFS